MCFCVTSNENCHFFNFSFCFIFFSFSFIFFHFLSFSFMFFHVSFHVLSCSFMFFHVLSCSFIFFSYSFIFFHILSYSFIFFQFLSISFKFLSISFNFFHFFQFLSISFIFFHFLSFSKSDFFGASIHTMLKLIGTHGGPSSTPSCECLRARKIRLGNRSKSPDTRRPSGRSAKKNRKTGQKPHRAHRRMNSLSRVQSDMTPGCEFASRRKLLKFFQKPPLTTSTTWDWNVNGLLGSPLLRRREGHDRGHLHQLFCLLRTTNRRTLWDSVQRDLGHGDNLLDKRPRARGPPPGHPTAAQGTSRICTYGTMSSTCAAACRCATGNGRTSTRGAGRAASTSPSSSKLKYTVLAALGRGVFWPMALFISSLSSPLALAIVGLRGAVWCVNSARAIATLRRSWRRNCLSFRCRLLMAAPGALSTAMFDSMKLFSQFAHKTGQPCGKTACVVVVCCCCCFR